MPGQNAVDYEYSASGLHHVIRKSGVTSISSTGGTENHRHTYSSRDASGNLLVATSTIGGSTSSSTYIFDELGRRQAINAPNWSHTAAASGAFDAVGNLEEYSVTDPLGTYNTINGYDSLYRLTDHQSTVANQQFTYDSVNNRLSGPAAFNSPTLTYSYNELNELTGAKRAGNLPGTVQVPVNGIVQPNANSGAAISSITVQLDQNTPISATLSAEQWEVPGGTLSVPVDGQQHTITVLATDSAGKQNTKSLALTIDADAAKAFIHDLNGNLVQQTVYSTGGSMETTAYQYDALDRLRFVFPPSGGSIEYKYDALHRRTAKTVTPNGETTSVSSYFLWTGQREIGAFDANLNLTQFRVLGQGMGNEIGAAVAVELRPNASSSWNVYEPVHDHRGNIAVLLSPNGTVAESYRYDAYGNVKTYDGSQLEISSSAVGNPWQFSSKRMDYEVGLIYFGRRYYAPTLARFITTDPAGFADGPNLYSYVGGNPMMYIDPDGRLAKKPFEWGIRGYAYGTYYLGLSSVEQQGDSDSSPYSSIGVYTDGTGNNKNNGMTGPTNIERAYGQAPADQYRIYIPGVGSSWFSRFFGGVFGIGAKVRSEWGYIALNNAYSDLGQVPISNYGFSRGAAGARDLTNLIYDRGLSLPGGGRDYNPSVFLGIYDTVGSYGIPGNRNDLFLNLSIPDVSGLTVRHATAEAEYRSMFPLARLGDGFRYTDALEISFEGAHSDVGGGYTDYPETSFNAFFWMHSEAVSAGFNPGSYDMNSFSPPGASGNFVHDSMDNPLYFIDQFIRWNNGGIPSTRKEFTP